MKMRLLTGVALATAFAFSSTSAMACTARITVENETSKKVNLLSCSTKRDNQDHWTLNAHCAIWAIGGLHFSVDPNKSLTVGVPTYRKPRKDFRLQISYKYTDSDSIHYAESTSTSCKSKNHKITLK